jgi:hypothetical protein
MATITTEDAARRLARVILSDIELYNRERPLEGESLDARLDEGRRLFATRVSPGMVYIFDAILADRGNGKANNQANGVTVAKPPANDQPAVITVVPPVPSVESSAEAKPALEPAPSVDGAPPIVGATTPEGAVAESIHDLPTNPNGTAETTTAEHTPGPALRSTPAAAVSARPVMSAPQPRQPTPPPLLLEQPTPAPVPTQPRPAPVVAKQPTTPPPVPKATPPAPRHLSATPPWPTPVAAIPTPEPIAAAAPENVQGPASEAVPVLRVGVSIPKILLVLAIAAGLVAVIVHHVR